MVEWYLLLCLFKWTPIYWEELFTFLVLLVFSLLVNNCKLLVDNGYVVYLKSNCEDLVTRMSGDQSRPLLQEGDLRETLENLFKIRDPIYTSISDYIIKTEGKHSNEIAAEIESFIKKLWKLLI